MHDNFNLRKITYCVHDADTLQCDFAMFWEMPICILIYSEKIALESLSASTTWLFKKGKSQPFNLVSIFQVVWKVFKQEKIIFVLTASYVVSQSYTWLCCCYCYWPNDNKTLLMIGYQGRARACRENKIISNLVCVKSKKSFSTKSYYYCCCFC